MAYSDFDLKKVTADFALRTEQSVDLFAGVAPVEPTAYLRAWLAEFAPVAVGFGSELGRCIYLVGPVLVEAKRLGPQPVTVIPGLTLDVDKNRGLSGLCDFVLAHSAEVFALRAPVFAAVEAKREDMTAALGQCAAELVAIRLFNEREKTVVPAVYGCATTGNVWRFMKLEGDVLLIDLIEYHLRDLPLLLGVLVHIAEVTRPVAAV